MMESVSQYPVCPPSKTDSGVVQCIVQHQWERSYEELELTERLWIIPLRWRKNNAIH